MSVKPIPKDFSNVTPFITVENADKVVSFLEKAFDARLISRMDDKNGKLWHAQMKLGDAMIMLGDTMGMHPSMPSCQYIYTPDADAMFKKAIAAGGKQIAPLEDQFYGDRAGGVQDPAGNVWWVATHIEDVAGDELKRRAKAQEDRQAKKAA